MKPIFRIAALATTASVALWGLANAAAEVTAEDHALAGTHCPNPGEGAKMFKVVALVKRREGMSVEEFRDYYETRHAPLALQYMPRICRYFRRFVNRQVDAVTGEVSEPSYDSVSEFWFATREDYEATMRNMGRPEVEAVMGPDEANLFDRSHMIILEVEEFESRIPGGQSQDE